MDDQRFDDLVRRLGTERLTRASALRGLVAGAVAALTGAAVGSGQTVIAQEGTCQVLGAMCEGGRQECCPGTVCNGLENPTRCRLCGVSGEFCCTSDTPCMVPGEVCLPNATCGVPPGGGGSVTLHQRTIGGLRCKSGETPKRCCMRSVKKGCNRKQSTNHAKQNCLKKGKKRCRKLLAGT